MPLKEPFLPQLVELKIRHEQSLEVLDQVSRAHLPEGPDDALTRIQAECDQWRNLALLRGNFIAELEDALSRAEREAVLALDELHARTKEVGRGERRGLKPTQADLLVDGVDRILRYAAMDQEEALHRERSGLPPVLPADANAVCGSEGLTLREAVKKVLRHRYARDSRGIQLLEADLEKLVDDRLDEAVRTYRKEVRKRKSARQGE